MEYAYKGKSKRIACARITGVNASFKDLCEVCNNVRGMATEDAINFLALAAEKKVPIYFARHNKRMGHRKQLGGRKGGWPVKSVKIVLEIVKSAAANAARLQLGSTKVVHIMANKQASFPRLAPKGRRMRHDYETAFVEVVLEEVQEKPVEKKKEEKKNEKKKEQKQPEEKKEEAPKQEKPEKPQEKKNEKQPEEKKGAPAAEKLEPAKA